MSASDAPPRRFSLWAIAAALCSALIVPPMCVIGPLLGLVGLVQTRPGKGFRGRGLAWTAIFLGSILSAGWIGGGVWWHRHVRTPLLEGPRAAIAAGMDGEVALFRSAFRPDPDVDPAAADLAAAQFLASLSARYGPILSARQDPDAEIETGLDRGGVTIPYLVRFERSAVRAEARFTLRDSATGQFVGRWGWIRIIDAEQGDLTYPSEGVPRPADG